MVIKILQAGCASCNKLESNARAAVTELGLKATVERVDSLKDIMSFGVMNMPALVVDDEVRLMGKTASVEEIKALL